MPGRDSSWFIFLDSVLRKGVVALLRQELSVGTTSKTSFSAHWALAMWRRLLVATNPPSGLEMNKKADFVSSQLIALYPFGIRDTSKAIPNAFYRAGCVLVAVNAGGCPSLPAADASCRGVSA